MCHEMKKVENCCSRVRCLEMFAAKALYQPSTRTLSVPDGLPFSYNCSVHWHPEGLRRKTTTKKSSGISLLSMTIIYYSNRTNLKVS